ncbi:hypothetical protein [Salinispora vitiensis]|uniref:hypothetical protein n=1 Tax=Salinispora vitiensis TaxID=999544 RepID=UPI00039C7247|nr:hypothetical protein [Salinispora vitiensis]
MISQGRVALADYEAVYVGADYESVPNPIQRWINEIRHKHAKTRTEFYERHAGFTRTPFPEIRHFK